jgi:hypothetical protein
MPLKKKIAIPRSLLLDMACDNERMKESYLKKNIPNALLSVIKVLYLRQQIPPRFSLISVLERNLYILML